MATTFEKTWQNVWNVQMPTSNTCMQGVNYLKGFIKGDVSATLLAGMWTMYTSCDGGTAGTTGDGVDRWGQPSSIGTTGSAASLTTGALTTGGIVVTGVTGMAANHVGRWLAITGAASAGNNSPSSTYWKIIRYISATSVEIYNPAGVTGDANNGAIGWTEVSNYTATTLINAVAGSSHAWAVLKSPAALGPYYLTIDYNSASANTCSLILSKVAPSGGTLTARPTASDEYGFTTAIAFVSNSTTPTQWWWHGGLATDGNFHLLGARGQGNGVFEQALIVQALADTKSADTYKMVMFCAAAGGATSDQLTATKLSTSGNIKGQNFNGTGALTGLVALDGVMASTNTSVLDDLAIVDSSDSKYDDLPVYIWNGVVANYTLKGRLFDIRRAPTSLPNGFCEPNPTTPASVVCGDYWFPTNAFPVL